MIGQAVDRVEDARLLRGEGTFGDDVTHDAWHVVFVRSPHAHARIRSIATEAALAQPAVMAVVTWHDLPARLQDDLPVLFPHDSLRPITPPPLARDEVRYAGQPVVAVVAQDRYLAEDAAELVVVEYEVLEPGTSEAARVSEEVGTVQTALAQAPRRLKRRFTVERSAGMPIECRVVSARDENGVLVVRDTTQSPSSIHKGLADALGIPPDKIAVTTGDIGGSFGSKGVYFYPEELIVPWLAVHLGHFVAWTEDRREHFTASAHERAQWHEVEAGYDADGRLLALDVNFVHDMGAFAQYGLIVPMVTASQLPGPYHLPNYRYEFTAIYTNTVPIAPYRGAGRPHGVFVIERTLDLIAADCGLDQLEVRRRNLIEPHQFPYRIDVTYQDGEKVEYESGDYPALFDLLQTQAFEGMQEARAQARASGHLVGAGIAACVEGTGLGPYEQAHIAIGPTGEIVVSVALSAQGQGHETMLAQIAATRLNAPLAMVRVRGGDSRHVAGSAGTYASRAAVMAGSAVALAADRLAARALQLGAWALGESDVCLQEGFVRSSSSQVSLGDLARIADTAAFDLGPDAARLRPLRGRLPPEAGLTPGLAESAVFASQRGAWAGGVHAVLVEVDPVTWRVNILRYAVVHDCGVMVNPKIVHGQIMGGVAQGVGGALYEKFDYGPDAILRNTDLRSFHLPTAVDVPPVEIHHLCTPSTTNPLGVKGVGEAGVIPVAAAIANAVSDALGIPIDEVPMPPATLQAIVHKAQSLSTKHNRRK